MIGTSDKLLGIDWGTSNRRAYLMERGGACLVRHADGEGMLSVNGNFETSLAALRRCMQVDPCTPVVMAGMVGSASGWQEVPYLDMGTPLNTLASHLMPVAGQRGVFIVPGYCSRGLEVDVMRGEETQLFGALALGVSDGWVVLPGTHSKWACVRAANLSRFATYMTGELFAMLAAGGTLASSMTGADDAAGFAAGVAQARRGRPLSQSLFGVRARVVAKEMAQHQARSFVSGLLIGTEFASNMLDGGQVTIIGAPALGELYRAAAAHFGITPQVLDSDDVFLAALRQFISKGNA